MEVDESWRTIDEQRLVVADLLAGLTPAQLATQSLCDAWTVRDVGAHLSLATTATLREGMRAMVRGRGAFDAVIREATLERGRRSPERIVADLREIHGSRKLALGTMWRDPLIDVLVHAQDIARPLGIDLPTPLDPAREATEWAWVRRFPFWPARRWKGLRLVATDVDWARGEGPEVRAPIQSLLLLSTGRAAGLRGTAGPGADQARARMSA